MFLSSNKAAVSDAIKTTLPQWQVTPPPPAGSYRYTGVTRHSGASVQAVQDGTFGGSVAVDKALNLMAHVFECKH